MKRGRLADLRSAGGVGAKIRGSLQSIPCDPFQDNHFFRLNSKSIRLTRSLVGSPPIHDTKNEPLP